jgi:hypothetical protein
LSSAIQKVFFAHMRKEEFQLLPLEYSTDLRWWIMYRDILELWLMPLLLQYKPYIVFSVTKRHHTFTLRLQHSWVGSDGSVKWVGVPISGICDLQISLPSYFSLCCFVKDEIYILPMPIILNNLQVWIWTAIAIIDQNLLQNVWHKVIYYLCVQGNKWSAYWTCIRFIKYFMSCFL